MEIWQKLTSSKVFEGIEENDIRALTFCSKARLKFVEKNEIIVSEGEKNNYCIYILSGKMKSVNYNDLGVENIVKTYFEGEIYGLNEAYTNCETYLHSLIATEKTQVILFNRFWFTKPCENNCSRHKKLVKNLTNIIAQSNLEMTNKINILSCRTTREKVLLFLKYLSKQFNSKYFDIPFNRQELANYLAVDRSALSIELSKMKAENLIDYNKNHFNLK